MSEKKHADEVAWQLWNNDEDDDNKAGNGDGDEDIKVNENVLKNNETPIIGFLGRICAEKGLKDLMKSSMILKENNFNHNLLIAGNLDDKRFKKYILHIKKLAKGNSNIKFLGLLNEKEKNNFLKFQIVRSFYFTMLM